MKKGIIGIIGGMGPMATVDLFQKIIKNTPAKSDQEHAHIIIDNNTEIPDRSTYLLYGGESPEFQIYNSACRLIDAGANVLIMPCNTAHYFYNIVKDRLDQTYKNINYSFIHMIDEAARTILMQGYEKVYLLATKGTYKSQIYQNTFIKYGIDVLTPKESKRDIVMKAIYNYKEGIPNYYRDKIVNTIEEGKLQGASKIVLGCTELPIIFRELHLMDNVIDPTEILAKSALKKIKICSLQAS